MAQLLHCLSLTLTLTDFGAEHQVAVPANDTNSGPLSAAATTVCDVANKFDPSEPLSLSPLCCSVQSCAHSTLANHRTAVAVIAVISIHTARQPFSVFWVYTQFSITAFPSSSSASFTFTFFPLQLTGRLSLFVLCHLCAADDDGDHCLCFLIDGTLALFTFANKRITWSVHWCGHLRACQPPISYTNWQMYLWKCICFCSFTKARSHFIFYLQRWGWWPSLCLLLLYLQRLWC